jgi:hypothetical protein
MLIKMNRAMFWPTAEIFHAPDFTTVLVVLALDAPLLDDVRTDPVVVTGALVITIEVDVRVALATELPLVLVATTAAFPAPAVTLTGINGGRPHSPFHQLLYGNPAL